MTFENPKVIWLSPACGDSIGSDGRTWCKDDVFETCEECGAKPVKYVLAEDQ